MLPAAIHFAVTSISDASMTLPATMRAVRLEETAGPQALRVEQIPVPAPGEGEVLVRVRAAALNRRDLFITQGKYPNIVLPHTLGADGAGEIAAFGSGVQPI